MKLVAIRRAAFAFVIAPTCMFSVSACSMLVPTFEAQPRERSSLNAPISVTAPQQTLVNLNVPDSTTFAEQPKKSPPLIAALSRPTKGSTLKCWQEGRLIVETNVQELPRRVSAVQAMRDATTGSEIYAFDLQRAFCLVQ